jgi:hypothetical protein
VSDKPEVSRNLEPAILSEMGLDPSDPAAYLEGIRKYAEGQTTQATIWYLKRKGPISLISKILRIAAILTGTIGGLLPLLPAPLLAACFGQDVQNLNGQLGYVFLALAGAFVLSDKVFGVSSKWMRYMTTVMALKRHQAEFEMDWAKLLLESQGNPLSTEQQTGMIDLLTRFRLKVVGEIEQETHTWVAEFKSNLALLEQQAKNRLPPKAGKNSDKS